MEFLVVGIAIVMWLGIAKLVGSRRLLPQGGVWDVLEGLLPFAVLALLVWLFYVVFKYYGVM